MNTNKSFQLTVICLSGLLAVFGLIELIQNAFVISFSGGVYGRGMYGFFLSYCVIFLLGFICGIICLFAGFLGAFQCYPFIQHVGYVKCFVIAAVISSAVAMWNDRYAFKFASEVEACAYFATDYSTYCDGYRGYECTGDSMFYSAAKTCFDTFHQNDFDCACVATENLECYDFVDISDCSVLYDTLPYAIKKNYMMLILSFAISTSLLFVIALSVRYYNPNSEEGYTVVAPTEVLESGGDEGL